MKERKKMMMRKEEETLKKVEEERRKMKETNDRSEFECPGYWESCSGGDEKRDDSMY
jgi:hypothetical protein